jgi:hypothetical protein
LIRNRRACTVKFFFTAIIPKHCLVFTRLYSALATYQHELVFTFQNTFQNMAIERGYFLAVRSAFSRSTPKPKRGNLAMQRQLYKRIELNTYTVHNHPQLFLIIFFLLQIVRTYGIGQKNGRYFGACCALNSNSASTPLFFLGSFW